MTNSWRCQYTGHEIRVDNYWNLLLFGRERLYIDSNLVDETKGFLRFSSILTATITRGDGSLARVWAYIHQAKFGLAIGCKIWVDVEMIFDSEANQLPVEW